MSTEYSVSADRVQVVACAQVNPTMPNLTRKREDDEEYDDSTQKAKKQKKLSASEKCKERTKQLQDAMTDLGNFLTDNSLVDNSARADMHVLSRICDDIMHNEEADSVLRHQDHAETLTYPLDVLGANALAGLAPKMRSQYKSLVRIVNGSRLLVCDLYRELLKEDTYPPSASYYAKPTEWVKWQTKPTAILNLRPSNNLGLPLVTLQPIFARFNAVLQQSLPEHLDTATAYRTAFSLCIDMAGSFKNEMARRDAFETCVKPLFPGYSFLHEVVLEPAENSTREYHTSKADIFVYGVKRAIMGAGFKAEFTGDAYMQVSRVYQTWVNRQLDNQDPEISHGLPMVIICVIGPLLIPAGGFFDGTSVIVEPLAPPCLMLPDHLRRRQETLARVLAAAKEALQSISRLEYAIPASSVPGTPRVYSTFSTFKDETFELTFNSRLSFNGSQDPHRNLLFLATSPISTCQVLVKLIVGDRYGTEAHKILAEAGFAPALYGTAKIQGAPTAYVMEYLPPNDGWKTLYEHARQHEDVKSHTLAPLRLIFAEMEKYNIVHGDFRPNNIMIRRKDAGNSYELRIIDFDWAGEDGKVNYPWCRNEDIPWPGQPNDPIVIPHDRKLLGSYLSPNGSDSWLGTSDLEGIPEGLTGPD